MEQVFRDVKSVLETRPVYHQRDENIRGHVFCSFLSLVLRKELDRRLEEGGHDFEWADIKQDLKALEEVVIEDNGRSLALRTQWGDMVGEIHEVWPTPAHDVYRVRGKKSELLIPAVKEIVRDIDLEGGRVVIRALDGLME